MGGDRLMEKWQEMREDIGKQGELGLEVETKC
jgi:hypothetical protein